MINFYSRNAISIFHEDDRNGTCKWRCGREVKYKFWCSRFPSQCPTINEKRVRAISRTKKLQARLGLNPMQNPEICRKNHSVERNKKSSESLKRLGQLGLLPQQIESKELKEKRRRNVSKALLKLSKEGKLWVQKTENWKEVESRNKKISDTMKKYWKENPGKLKENRRKVEKTFRRKNIPFMFRLPKGRIPTEVNGEVIFFRSKFEKRLVKILNKFSLNWIFEPFWVQFWNSKENKYTFTMPDFFLPQFMTLIEVKGEEGMNSWLTKDKVRGMKEFGFNTLVLGKKDIERLETGEIDLIKKLQQVPNNA